VRAARPEPPSLATIFAAYDRATHAPDITTLETEGTLTGEGLSGTFHRWRRGDDERDDERLGPRTETTLRRGERVWVRNANGNVRELHGVVLRRARTDRFIATGDFLTHPERARVLGFGDVDGRRAWRVEVTAAGGEPETLWIAVDDGTPLRTEFLDGDGPTYIDDTDWRDVQGQKIPFRSVTTDGTHAFDVVEQTTSVRIDAPIADDVFAPLVGRRIVADGVQTVPLVPLGVHVGCTVSIDGASHVFLVDSGAQGILIDTRLARSLRLDETGSLEVRGAVREGGMHVALLSHLGIGNAALDDLLVSTLDLADGFGGGRVEGILGYPFFASALVQLDFVDNVIRFGPPGSFDPPGVRVDLDVDREIPEAPLRFGPSLVAPVIVDSGNSGEMLIYKAFALAHPEVVPRDGPRSTNYGVGGSDAAYRTHLEHVELGGFPIDAPTVDVIDAKNGAFADRIDAGNIGLGVLRRFTITFDLSNAAMYVLPRGARTPATTS
jgi:hypothetical protein